MTNDEDQSVGEPEAKAPEGHTEAPKEEIMESGEHEEVEDRRPLPNPDVPTQSEVEEHRVDHIPYRSWCR